MKGVVEVDVEADVEADWEKCGENWQISFFFSHS